MHQAAFSGRSKLGMLHESDGMRARRALRGRSPELARQEAWALLLVHSTVATAAARAAALAQGSGVFRECPHLP